MAAQQKTTGTSLIQGSKVPASNATPEKLSALTAKIIKVHIRAMKSNTGIVAVGADNTVKAANDKSELGYPLDAGQSIDIEIDRLDKIWVDSATTGDGVTFVAIGY